MYLTWAIAVFLGVFPLLVESITSGASTSLLVYALVADPSTDAFQRNGPLQQVYGERSAEEVCCPSKILGVLNTSPDESVGSSSYLAFVRICSII